jgi:hypothetical protein
MLSSAFADPAGRWPACAEAGTPGRKNTSGEVVVRFKYRPVVEKLVDYLQYA